MTTNTTTSTTTSFIQRHIGTAIMVVLLAVCAVSLRCLSTTRHRTPLRAPQQGAAVRNRRKGRGNRYRRVTLTEKAAERTGIETAAVRGGTVPKVLPALSPSLTAPSGTTPRVAAFVYTVTAPLSYIRAPITVDGVEGDQAILSAGPEAGTEIVTQGVAELYGAETGPEITRALEGRKG